MMTKPHGLEEISRTEMQGVSLWWEQFETETAIKGSDCLGASGFVGTMLDMRADLDFDRIYKKGGAIV